MTERAYDRLFRPLVALCAVFALFSLTPSAAASPFGQGVFGANVPFGSLTSLAISLGSDVNISFTLVSQQFIGTGSHTITVTSTDVVGYGLYVYVPNDTDMDGPGIATIPASTNTTEAPLSNNTWGYNIDGSSNYIGMTTTPTLLKTASGPYGSGDNTTVNYGVLTGDSKADGTYTVSVTYTAVALSE